MRELSFTATGNKRGRLAQGKKAQSVGNQAPPAEKGGVEF